MAITRAASGKSDQVSQCTAGQFVYCAAPYWRTEGGDIHFSLLMFSVASLEWVY